MTGARNRTGRSALRIDPFPLIALALLIVILIWMVYPVLWLFALASRGYNEGWNAFMALRAMGDLPLYPQDQTLHTNNYPPLSFYVVGALGRLVGDNIVAGRIVSLVATVAVAGEIAVVVRLLGGRWPAAGFAGMVFVGGLIDVASVYIGLNDPQLLGLAVMLAGLIALLSRQGAGGHLIVAAALLVVAGLIKHNLLALPLAITAWLFLTDRRALRVWLLAAGAAFCGALLGLWLVYGPAVLDNLASARSYSLGRMMLTGKHALDPLQIPLVGWFVLIMARPGDPANQLVAWYGGCSIVIAVLFAGGAGVGHNVFFDLLIASSLASGLLLQQAGQIARSCPPQMVRAVVAAAYLVGIGLSLPKDPLRLAEIDAAEVATRADVAFLAGLEGRVLCEILALCYWAGKGLEVDTFNARQGFLVSGHDERVLLDLLASGAFAAVQLTNGDPARDDERISPAFMVALHHHYRLARTSPNGVFFLPSSVR
jgi:hypothetical protein